MRILLLLLGLWAGPLLAADAPAEDGRIQFQVTETEAVANDRLRVMLQAEAEQGTPDQVADAINRTMTWALERARAVDGVTVQTGEYSIVPMRYKDRPLRWRGSQQLWLEGSDVTAIAGLMATLQGRLQVRSTRFLLSDAARAEVESRLIDRAVAAFRARAAQLARAFGAAGHRLHEAQVITAPQTAVPMVRARAMAMEADVATPGLEAGESRVQVTVSGSILLEP